MSNSVCTLPDPYVVIIIWLKNNYRVYERIVNNREDIVRRYRNPQSRVEKLNELAEQLQTDNPLEGASVAMQAAAIARSHSIKPMSIAASSRIAGLCFYAAGAYREALSHYQDAYRIYEQNAQPLEIAGVLQNIGLVFRRLEQHNNALEAYQKAADGFAACGNVRARQIVLINIATLAAHLSDPVKVFASYSECLHTLEKHDDDLIRAVVTGNLGRLFIDLGDYDKGEQFTLQSAGLHQKRNDNIGIGHAYGSMAFIAKHKGDIQKSLDLFQQSAEAYSRGAYPSGRAAALCNAADIALSVHSLDLAKLYANQSLTEFIAIGDKENEAKVRSICAEIAAHEQYQEQAMEYINSALGIIENSINYGLHAQLYHTFGKICEMCSMTHQAIQYFTKGLALALEHNVEMYIYQFNERLSAVYEKQGDFHNALFHSRAFYENKSTFDKSINSREIQELRYRLEIEKAERESEILRLKHDNLQSQLQSQANEINTTAMALAHKNDVLNHIRTALTSIAEKKSSEQKKYIHSLVDEIGGHIRSDKNRRHLSEKLHDQQREFIERLTHAIPDLRPREIEICSLIRLQLSSKEISDLLCVSEKSVEIYRHRIRAKLQLPAAMNLTTYLAGF